MRAQKSRMRYAIASTIVGAVVLIVGQYRPSGVASRVRTIDSSFASTSTTIGANFLCAVDLKLYDPVEVGYLRFDIIGFQDCSSPIPGVSVRRLPSGQYEAEGFPVGFTGPEAIITCDGGFFHFECPPQLDDVAFGVSFHEARGGDGTLIDVPVICPSYLDCTSWPCPPEQGPFVADLCGDPDRNGQITASDALFALQAAVSIVECAVTQCDADRSGTVNASDALRILYAAVGLPTELICPGVCESGYC